MEKNKVLVFGCSWTPDDEKKALAKLWARTIHRTAEQCDVLVIDCNSPMRPGIFLKDSGFEVIKKPIEDWGEDLRAESFGSIQRNGSEPIKLVTSFRENVGHLSMGGKDGWGRSFSKGVEIAIACEYEWLVYIEPDLLSAFQVLPIVEKMQTAGVKIACPWDFMYQFLAHEITFARVAYLRDSDFVGKYDWKNTPPPTSPQTIPERRCELIWKDDLFILPLRGIRNDRHAITVDNVNSAFVYGLDWITHCKDFAVYEAFLRGRDL